MPTTTSYACLYTKHKTQKRKVWHDGRLVVQSGVAVLYEAQPVVGGGTSLDACPVSSNALQNDQLLQGEHYLITVEGPWNHEAAVVLAPTTITTPTILPQRTWKKFQKPAFRPPPPLHSNDQQPHWKKRRRPLQPGELQQQLYSQPPQELQQALQAPPVHPPAGVYEQPSGLYEHAPSMQPTSHAPPSDMYNPHPPQPGFYEQPQPTSHAPPSDGYNPQRMQTVQQQAPSLPLVEPQSSMPPPPACSSSTEPATDVPRSTPTATSLFCPSSNGFDPNSFYGEDDDDEERPCVSDTDLLALFGGGTKEQPPHDDFVLPPTEDSSSSEDEE